MWRYRPPPSICHPQFLSIDDVLWPVMSQTRFTYSKQLSAKGDKIWPTSPSTHPLEELSLYYDDKCFVSCDQVVAWVHSLALLFDLWTCCLRRNVVARINGHNISKINDAHLIILKRCMYLPTFYNWFAKLLNLCQLLSTFDKRSTNPDTNESIMCVKLSNPLRKKCADSQNVCRQELQTGQKIYVFMNRSITTL